MFIAPSEMNSIKKDSTPDGIIMPCSPCPDNMLPNAEVALFEQAEAHTSY